MCCNTCTLSMPSAEIFPLYGKKYLSSASNKQAETKGSTKMKVHHKHSLRSVIFMLIRIDSENFLPMTQAPGLPGEYEVRYSPNSLRGSNTGMREDTYIAVTRFTVDTVWNQKNSPSWLRLEPF